MKYALVIVRHIQSNGEPIFLTVKGSQYFQIPLPMFNPDTPLRDILNHIYTHDFSTPRNDDNPTAQKWRNPLNNVDNHLTEIINQINNFHKEKGTDNYNIPKEYFEHEKKHLTFRNLEKKLNINPSPLRSGNIWNYLLTYIFPENYFPSDKFHIDIDGLNFRFIIPNEFSIGFIKGGIKIDDKIDGTTGYINVTAGQLLCDIDKTGEKTIRREFYEETRVDIKSFFKLSSDVPNNKTNPKKNTLVYFIDVNTVIMDEINKNLKEKRYLEVFPHQWLNTNEIKDYILKGDSGSGIKMNYVSREAFEENEKVFPAPPAPPTPAPAPPAPPPAPESAPPPDEGPSKRQRAKEKYLKYKSKYLKLKKLLGQM